jgi:serine/threonine-protein kinase
MIHDEHLGLVEAARAIAAGRRVDWDAIESSGGLSDSVVSLLRQLRVVENISELHRSLPDPWSSTGTAHSSANTGATALAKTPEVWGALRLLEHVGQGVFGEVFRAWDPRLEREVALKLLRQRDWKEGSVGPLVVDEGRLLARIRHPNVVTVFGADCIDGQVGLWMEFVRGRTMEAVLREHGPFSAQEATLIGLDVCRALSAVHCAGLIHRDVKAQNVMREDGGRLVLMDFGAGRDMLLESSFDLAGTPLYLAPEVFRGTPPTSRSDIYGVGVLLYHLVTASYPVKGRTVSDLREAHARSIRTWLRDDRPDLPDDFVQTVERALDGDPESRYQSAGAMEAALSRVVAKSGALQSPEAHTVLRPRVVHPLRSISLSLAAAVAVFLLAKLAPTWGDRLLSRSLPPSVTPRAIGDVAPPSVVIRRIPLPDFSFIGSPSPDGKLFSLADGDGNVAVFDLASGQLRQVTRDATFSTRASQYAAATAISPDGRLIAYGWSALDGQFELRLSDLDGKRPQVLLRNPSIDYAVPFQWTRDGKSILAELRRSDHSVRLALVSIEDGSTRPVKELGSVSPMFASISPDSEFIVYDAPQQNDAVNRDVFIVRSDGSDDHRLIEHPADDAQPVWSPDGRTVLFASNRGGTNDIWSISVDGGFATGQPVPIHRNIGRMWLRGLAETGSYFYFLTAGPVDVYEAELRGKVAGKVVTVSASYSGWNISSLWSPDGQMMAYASRRGTSWFGRGSTALAIRDLQTNEQRELAPALNGFLLRAWSPDGRHLLVGSDQQQGIYEIDIDNGHVRPILLDGVARRPDWLPDGRITYLSAARREIVARDLDTGAEEVLFDPRTEGVELMTNLMGRGYRLAPDGETLAFTGSTGVDDGATRMLSIKVLRGGPAHELVRVSAPESLMFQDWTPDGAYLLFTRSSPKANELVSLWRVSIHGGDPQPLGLSMIGLRDVSVHSDATRITFTAGYPTNELWAMDNVLNR